jgi:hypothetical protein
MRSYELRPIYIAAKSRGARTFVLIEKAESVSGICRHLSKIGVPNMHFAFGEKGVVVRDRVY